MTEQRHQFIVEGAWPSGRFVACTTCVQQSRGSRNEDDLVDWAYTHLGRPRDTPILAVPRRGTWDITPDGALF